MKHRHYRYCSRALIKCYHGEGVGVREIISPAMCGRIGRMDTGINRRILVPSHMSPLCQTENVCLNSYLPWQHPIPSIILPRFSPLYTIPPFLAEAVPPYYHLPSAPESLHSPPGCSPSLPPPGSYFQALPPLPGWACFLALKCLDTSRFTNHPPGVAPPSRIPASFPTIYNTSGRSSTDRKQPAESNTLGMMGLIHYRSATSIYTTTGSERSHPVELLARLKVKVRWYFQFSQEILWSDRDQEVT